MGRLTTHIIRLQALDVPAFCDAASRCSTPVSIASIRDRRHSVDASSPQEVVSLDLAHNLVISYEGPFPAYEAYLKKFIV